MMNEPFILNVGVPFRADERFVKSELAIRALPLPRLGKLLLHVGQKLRHGHIQTSGNRKHRLDRQIPLAALDASHIRPVQAAMIGEGFL
jgi:hypothetical protein